MKYKKLYFAELPISLEVYYPFDLKMCKSSGKNIEYIYHYLSSPSVVDKYLVNNCKKSKIRREIK